MELIIKGEKFSFRKCFKSTEDKIELDTWKSFMKVNNEKVGLDVENECFNCGVSLTKEINWKAVKDFMERLPNHIDELLIKSTKQLRFLASEIGIWTEEQIENSYFYLDGITYLSPDLTEDRLKHPRFGLHKFQLFFTLENDTEDNLDVYGSWITCWFGNQISEIKRLQI